MEQRTDAMGDDRRLLRLAIASLTDTEACPSVEELADYTLGVLSSTMQLQITKHVRECAVCQHLVIVCASPVVADDLQAVAATAMKPRLRMPIRVAQLLPFAHNTQLRGSDDHVRHYRSADITVELIWTPPDGDLWHITGRLTRTEQGLGNQEITLRAGRRRLNATSDTAGYFTFPAVPAGRYTLGIVADGVEVQLRGIILTHDEL